METATSVMNFQVTSSSTISGMGALNSDGSLMGYGSLDFGAINCDG